MMKFHGKRLLFIDLETSGLPLTRKGARRIDKYPSPTINIAYSRSRLLTLSCNLCDFDGKLTSTYKKLWIRDNTDLDDASYTTNKGKYKGDTPIRDIITQFNELEWDYVIGHNVLFDLHILAHEARIVDECYKRIMSAINECKYFCTLTMSKRLGVDESRTKLCDVVSELNHDGKPTSFTYHDSCDDVLATMMIFELGMTMMYVPKSIDALTDLIYAAVVAAAAPDVADKVDKAAVPDVADKVDKAAAATATLDEYAFKHYVSVLSPSHAVMYPSGRCVFTINHDRHITQMFSLDGTYTYNGVTYDCHLLCDEPGKCPCGSAIIGSGLCTKCAVAEDVIIAAGDEFLAMKPDHSFVDSMSYVKTYIPKSTGKRMRCLPIEITKKGRSNMLPMNKVEFYVDKKLYKYYSMGVGASKI